MAVNGFIAIADATLDQVERAEHQWRRHFNELPAVTDDGTSQCGFARGLYERSYESEFLLRQARDELASVLESANGHIDETSGELRDAEDDDNVTEMHRENLRIAIKEARRMVVKLRQRISSVNDSLTDADRKRFPGMRRWTEPRG